MGFVGCIKQFNMLDFAPRRGYPDFFVQLLYKLALISLVLPDT